MIEGKISHLDDARLLIEIRDYYALSRRRLTFHKDTLDLMTAEGYLESLCNHIQYVREAGEKLGVSEAQLKGHDDSKWSHEEFPYYALNFFGDKSAVDQGKASSNFAQAWLHHIHHNPHHWQHWIFPDGYTPKESSVENGIVQMPNIYALEMIADWMGASMAYTGSWDMQKWLWENMPKIRLHSITADFVRGQLDLLGYADTVFMQRWGHEPETAI